MGLGINDSDTGRFVTPSPVTSGQVVSVVRRGGTGQEVKVGCKVSKRYLRSGGVVRRW
jgi:hypothetical protein